VIAIAHFKTRFPRFSRLDEDSPASLLILLRPLGILLKEALDQTEQRDNSYQVLHVWDRCYDFLNIFAEKIGAF
jgi:hypothetical protein